MAARTIMLQGTASSVGKSLLTAALCRIFRQDGLRVAPFKSQNMSNNSFVTRAGGEMGRAQVVQAEAAGVEPEVDMNPILLKPTADHRSQVVVHGRPVANLTAREYYQHKPEFLGAVEQSLERLRARYDVVVIEGAGSPAEVNLKESDIVNMRVARLANAPVLLVGDIDRGGVFAALVGTLELLDPEERALVRGFVINKFRGDVTLLTPGLDFLEGRTGVPVLGVVPYLHGLQIAEEDAVALEDGSKTTGGDPAALLDVAVVRFPRISNFDDFDALATEPGVRVRYVESVFELGRPHLLILPGTKATVADLEWLRATGLAEAATRHATGGGATIGVCGGFQMLGSLVRDPHHVESERDETPGLGLLPLTTTFAAEKVTVQARGRVRAARGLFAHAAGEELRGYEIHMGRSEGAGVEQPIAISEHGAEATDSADGALDATGWVLGTYLHGLFDADGFRGALLRAVREKAGLPDVAAGARFSREAEYDRLAATVRAALDMRRVYELCGLTPPGEMR